jgi:hypothetical protein
MHLGGPSSSHLIGPDGVAALPVAAARRVRESRQEPDFPCASFAHVDPCPMAVDLNGAVLPVTTAAVFAYCDDRVGSQRPNLVDCYVGMVHARFEYTLISLLDFLSSGLDRLCSPRN